jgi:hypothetical protein
LAQTIKLYLIDGFLIKRETNNEVHILTFSLSLNFQTIY